MVKNNLQTQTRLRQRAGIQSFCNNNPKIKKRPKQNTNNIDNIDNIEIETNSLNDEENPNSPQILNY